MITEYRCENCNRVVSRNAKQCLHCGVWFAYIQCSQCGFRGSEKDFSNDRCPNCGVYVDTEAIKPRQTPMHWGEGPPTSSSSPHSSESGWAVGFLILAIIGACFLCLIISLIAA